MRNTSDRRDLTIYNIAHFKQPGLPIHPRSLYQNWQVGLGRSDLDGDNRYAEMRCHHAVWRQGNIAGDHSAMVGFQHYRRWLFLDQFAGVLDIPQAEALRREIIYLKGDADALTFGLPKFASYTDAMLSISAGDVGELAVSLRQYDIVVPRPWRWNVRTQFTSSHGLPPWAALEKALVDTGVAAAYPELTGFYPCNMFIMRWEYFCGYMEFWKAITDRLAQVLPAHAGLEQNARMIGVLSERIFTLWLYLMRITTPGLRVLEVPHIYCGAKFEGAR